MPVATTIAAGAASSSAALANGSRPTASGIQTHESRAPRARPRSLAPCSSAACRAGSVHRPRRPSSIRAKLGGGHRGYRHRHDPPRRPRRPQPARGDRRAHHRQHRPGVNARPSRRTARQIAFVVTRVDMKKNKYFSQVWLAAADGSQPPRPGDRTATTTATPRGAPTVASLAFTSRRGENKGEATLHVLPMIGARRDAHGRDDAGRHHQRDVEPRRQLDRVHSAAPATSATRAPRTRAGRRRARSSGSSPAQR